MHAGVEIFEGKQLLFLVFVYDIFYILRVQVYIYGYPRGVNSSNTVVYLYSVTKKYTWLV